MTPTGGTLFTTLEARSERDDGLMPHQTEHLQTRTVERFIMLELPLKTVSEINRRDHWTARSKRRKVQQHEVNIEWKCRLGTRGIKLPCRVTMTRIGPKLLDDDNLRSAFKNVRDQIARLLGVNDSPTSPASWDYKQEAIGRHEYAVRIEVASE